MSISDTTSSKTKPRFSRAWIVWGLSAAFYFYEFFLQVSPSVMVPELMHSFSVNAEDVGFLAGIYFVVYASLQIPVGMLIDRFGPRILLTFATATCGIASYLFSHTDSLTLAIAARALLGLGSAFSAVGCLKLAANWFPPQRFALLTGLMVTIGMLGAIVGGAPLAHLVTTAGWRQSMLYLSLIGICLSVLIALVVRDSPSKTQTQPHTTTLNQTDTKINKIFYFLAGLKRVVRNKQNWYASLYGGLMFAPTSAFGALWGVPFLMQSYDLSRTDSAAMVSFVFIGWVFGSPISGWVSDHIGRRLPTMWIGAIGSLIAVSGIIYIPHLPELLLRILLFSFGFFSSGFLPAFSVVRELNSSSHNATALGFINTLNMVGGAILQPLIGYMLDLHWDGQYLHGVPVYSAGEFQTALSLLPLCFAASLLFLPFLKETYCKPVDE